MVDMYRSHLPHLPLLEAQAIHHDWLLRNKRIVQKRMNDHLEEHGCAINDLPRWDKCIRDSNEYRRRLEEALAKDLNPFIVSVLQEATTRTAPDGTRYKNYGDVMALCVQLSRMAHLL